MKMTIMNDGLMILVMFVLASGCDASPQNSHPSEAKRSTRPERFASKNLPNAIRLNDRVISGGQPDGEAAFQELRALGVATMISVDGAKPDIALAKKYSLRCVHIPHGYDGIAGNRVMELAVAVRRLPGPIYIYCHHGQHRSPAAAAVACVATGLMEQAEAVDVLKMAGTSENYRGLFQAVTSAHRYSDQSLDEAQIELPELAELPPLAEAMVSVERNHDRLKAMAKNRWSRLTDDPDSDPSHEALLLKEQFNELVRLQDSADRPDNFLRLLRDSETAAGDLETALRVRSSSKSDAGDLSRLNRALEFVTQKCTECHHAFRDVPIGEKQTRGQR